MEYASPIGTLRLFAWDGILQRLLLPGESLTPRELSYLPEEEKPPIAHSPAKALEDAILWLDDYFAGRRPAPWTGPLPTLGTPYQKRVWNALRTIPYGEIRTYLQIAQIAAAPGTTPCPRAAGQALNKNPLPILLPCHRVIATTGALTGFAAGLNMKERLLLHEKGGGRKEEGGS